MRIRFASPEDSPALLAVYASYISTPITFECELPSEEAFAGRVAHIGAFYPYLVCEEAGRITGYAYAHRHMEREAYQWNAELSVYLAPARTARGLGKTLYGLLMELLRLQGVRTVFGCVTVPNAASEALHRSLGFDRVGTYQQAGWKNGAWHDVAWFSKAIGPYDATPQPPVSVHALNPETVERVLRSTGQGGV